MKYVTLTAKTYEDALKKARDQYGNKLRVHSRKDYTVPGFLGLGKRKRCELTCFVTETEQKIEQTENNEDDKLLKRFEQEAKTPSPDGKEALLVEEVSKDELVKPYLVKAKDILKLNEFSEDYSESILSQLKDDLTKALPKKPDRKQFELLLLDKIAGSFEIDYQTQTRPPRCTVILGTTGTGKTTTVAKISAMYGVLSSSKGNVKIITLDTFRIGAYEQIENFGKSLGVPVYKASDLESFNNSLEECKDADLILVDTIGKSPNDGYLADRLDALLSVCPKEDTGYYIAVSASMKSSDIEKSFEQFDSYAIKSIIITKVDETNAVGNVISICSKKKLPILFVTDGQKVPSNIHRASNTYLMGLIKGLSPDLIVK